MPRNPWPVVGVVALCVSCTGAAPASPTGGASSDGSDLVIEVTCPSALVIGERRVCVALARLPSGQTPVVNTVASWSSTRPEVVAVDSTGQVTGQTGGQAFISASWGGRHGTAPLVVTDEDALRLDSGQGQQGDFTPGSTVTMYLQGYYSVSSAASGRLSLRITDQTRTITTTSPKTVAKGGDFFLMSATFVVPQDSVEVCRTAVLEVGAVTVTAPLSKSYLLWCIPIRR